MFVRKFDFLKELLNCRRIAHCLGQELLPTALFYIFQTCFWHGCPDHSTKPENNKEFWEKKLGATKVRDVHVTQELEKKGWLVIRVWEHEFKNPDAVAERITNALDGSENNS